MKNNIVIEIFIFLIIFNYLFLKNKYKVNIIEKSIVTSIYRPTIINDQSYFFVKVNYTNITFYQCIRSDDIVSDFIKKYGKWDECQLIYDIWSKSSRNGIFLDIGANIGSCSFLFAEIGIKVIAFEPLANNLFPFTLTTFSNKKFKKHITIYPYALGKENSERTIHIRKKNWGASSLYYMHRDYNDSIYVMKLDEFDKIIPNIISIIKIDVEGAEYDLFRGAEYFFKTHHAEYMFIEASCGKKNSNGLYDIEKLYSLMKKIGYDIIIKVDCKNNVYGNILVKEIN